MHGNNLPIMGGILICHKEISVFMMSDLSSGGQLLQTDQTAEDGGEVGDDDDHHSDVE